MVYIARKKMLKRSEKRLKRTPLKRLGKRGRVKIAKKKQARELYFDDRALAPCQICGLPMLWTEADACHKRKASLCGGEESENLIAAHGFRCGAINCHHWADETRERQEQMVKSSVNVKTGGKIEWTAEQEKSLWEFLKTGASYLARVCG